MDPFVGRDEVGDLFVVDGLIVDELPKGVSAREVDCRGKVIAPGLIDAHVHLREPGGEESETIASGCRAAAAGGFTAVACMPNTSPAVDNAATVGFIKKRSAGAAAEVLIVGALTKARAGEDMADLGEMASAGVVAFSDDGSTPVSSSLLRSCMEYARMLGKPVISHCLDPSLASGGVMREGAWSARLGLEGIPAEAEEVIVARDIALARLSGCRLHIAHVSAAGSLELIRSAKREGLKVTCEATPHHLWLTDEELKGYDPSYKVSPPLGTEEDRQSLRQALLDGTIDIIASDHAPHCAAAKDVELDRAAWGSLGLETSLSAMLTLARRIKLPLSRLLEMMVAAPARLLGLERAGLVPGARADLVVIDQEAEFEVDSLNSYSLSRNCAFQGLTFTGKAVMTMLAGKVTMEDGLVAE